MTNADIIRIEELLNSTQVTFDAKIKERVASNWLTQEFPKHFEGTEGDAKVVAFLMLSNQKGCEKSLGGDIAQIITDKMIENI